MAADTGMSVTHLRHALEHNGRGAHDGGVDHTGVTFFIQTGADDLGGLFHGS